MKAIYSSTAAVLTILAGAALFRPHMVNAGQGLATTANSVVSQAAIPAQKMRLAENYGKLPLSFEANQGQTDSRVKFLSRGRGYSLFLTGNEAVLQLERTSQKSKVKSQRSNVKNSRSPLVTRPLNEAEHARLAARDQGQMTNDAVLRMKLVGANADAAVTGAEELPGKSNYFIGNDPKKWRTNVPNYAKVKYANVYPGVDLVYYGNQGGQLEYDFVVAPGADPGAITFDVGAVREPPTVAAVSDRQTAVGTPPLQKRAHRDAPLQIAANGDLAVKTNGGDVRFHKPVVYQEQFTVDSSQSTVQDEQRNTTDDPKSKIKNRQFLDGRYVLQASNRVGFKVASYDHARPLFIHPVLSYSTYLGGSSYDYGWAIAVDSSGNAYVTGWTGSTDFPTVKPLQGTNHGGEDVFVAKLNAAGSALLYSTYLGGSDDDECYGITADSSGNAYVTGNTSSTDFPTVNPFQATCGGCSLGYTDAFVTEFNAAGSALVYSTCLGGSDFDFGQGIAVDSSGNAYVTGWTNSADFPTANVRDFPVYNEDLNLFKVFDIKEQVKLRFETQLGNAVNRTFFCGIDTTWTPGAAGTTDFGHVTSQCNQPRHIDFGLKLTW